MLISELHLKKTQNLKYECTRQSRERCNNSVIAVEWLMFEKAGFLHIPQLCQLRIHFVFVEDQKKELRFLLFDLSVPHLYVFEWKLKYSVVT